MIFGKLRIVDSWHFWKKKLGGEKSHKMKNQDSNIAELVNLRLHATSLLSIKCAFAIGEGLFATFGRNWRITTSQNRL